MEEQTKRKINKITLSVFFGIALIIAIIIIATGGDGESKKKEPFMNIDHAWIIAKGMVKDKLKSPSTADFPWAPDGYKMDGDSTILLQGYVDSQNSFGAMMRTKFIIKLKYYGGEWTDHQRWQELDFITIE